MFLNGDVKEIFMNILVICETFSKTGPTSMCLLSVVNEAVKRGHRCRVVSAAGVVFDSKVSLEYKNSSDLETKNEKKGLLSRLKRIITPFLRYFTWPDDPFSDLDFFYHAVAKEIDADRPDIVICSVGSLHNICISNRIKDKHPDIKCVPYFLDSILGGAKLRIMPKSLHNKRAVRYEERYLKNADSIVMMKYVEEKYRSLAQLPSYFSKIKFLDLPLYNPENHSVVTEHKHFGPNAINMFFAGSMPKNIRDPRFVLSVFQRVKRPDLNLYIAGTSYYQEDLDSLAKNDSRVHLLGVTPHETVLEMMNEADILLSIGNNLDCMIPCKIFEYMSTGKPILATYKRETDPSIEYFSFYKNSLLLDEKTDLEDASKQIESFLMCVKENKKKELVDALYNNTPAAFCEYVETI